MNRILFSALAVIIIGVLLQMQFGAGNDGSAFTIIEDVSIDKQDLESNGRRMDELAYTITLERDGVINSARFESEYIGQNIHSDELEVSSTLSAKLNIKFILEDNDKKLFFGQFSDFDNQNRFSGLTKEQSSQPFAFYLMNNGVITLYEDVAPYDPALKDLALQLFPYLQTIGKDDSRQKWKTREADLIGNYKAEYFAGRNDGLITIEKHKLIYDRTNQLPSLFRDSFIAPQAKVIDSKSIIKFGKNLLWATEIRLSERIVLDSGSDMISDVSTIFSAHIAKFDSEIELPESLVEFMALSATNNIKIDGYYSIDENLSALASDRNLADLFLYYSDVFKTDEFLAQEILINYLREHPELSKAFVDKIYSVRDKLTDREEVKLWYALAKAGHKDAQEAYVYALTNPEFKQIIQYRAIGHIRIFDQPTEEFVEDLWRIQGQLSNSSTGNDQDNKILARGMLFALGTLSASDKVDDQIKEEILSTLEERLYSAYDESEERDFIIAIGNTKNSSLLTSIAPYLDSDNPQLREKAFGAIARMPGNEVVDVYMEAYDRVDAGDQQIQLNALNNFNKMTMTSKSIEWASYKVLELNNNIETKRLIKILGENKSDFPEVETTLRKLLTDELSPNLKSDIYRYITPLRD